METTIVKRITGRQMEAIFEHGSSIVNVKYYKARGAQSYILQNYYTFDITIRHPEDKDPNKLFAEAMDKMFPTPTPKPPKKRIFLVVTEVGRVKGRLSYYIAEIMPNKGLRLIDNSYTCSASSHKGIESEAVQALVNARELPITAINAAHYRDGRVKSYSLIIVEGRGLNYINQIN